MGCSGQGTAARGVRSKHRPATLSWRRRDNPRMPTVLIKLTGGTGVVHRDDGEIMVTRDVSSDRGQPLCGRDDYRPAQMGPR
jgi:hypothetical protein